MAKTYQESVQAPGIQASFKVGDGVSFRFNGDTYPGTVESITFAGRKVHVRPDFYQVKKMDNEGDALECEFTPNPAAELRTFLLSKGASMFSDGTFRLYKGRHYSYNRSF